MHYYSDMQPPDAACRTERTMRRAIGAASHMALSCLPKARWRCGWVARLPTARLTSMTAGALILMSVGSAMLGQSIAQHAEEPLRFGDWQVICRAEGACIAASRTPRIQAFYGRIREDQALRLVFRVPPGAEVGDPVAVRLDSGWGADLRLLQCGPEWCQTIVDRNQTDSVLRELQQARRATVAYLFADRIIIAELSLAGLADAANHMAGLR